LKNNTQRGDPSKSSFGKKRAGKGSEIRWESWVITLQWFLKKRREEGINEKKKGQAINGEPMKHDAGITEGRKKTSKRREGTEKRPIGWG